MIVNEISLNIEELLKNVLPEKKREAFIKVGTLVQNKAKERCKAQTGTLRNSISYVIDDGQSYSVYRSEGSGMNKKLIEEHTSVNGTTSQVSIGTNVEYAPYHHNNNPFLQSAIDENIDAIKGCFNNLL